MSSNNGKHIKQNIIYENLLVFSSFGASTLIVCTDPPLSIFLFEIFHHHCTVCTASGRKKLVTDLSSNKYWT